MILAKIYSFSERSQFWLKLAYLNQTPLKKLVAEHETHAAVLAVLGRTKTATLTYNGYALPAVLNLEDSTIDVAGFQPDPLDRSPTGLLILQFPQERLQLQVSYSAQQGWYPTQYGVDQLRKEVGWKVLTTDVAAAIIE